MEQKNQSLHLLVQYQQKEIRDFRYIEAGLLDAMEKLAEKLQGNS